MKVQLGSLSLFILLNLLASGCSSPVLAQSINTNPSDPQMRIPTMTPVITGYSPNATMSAELNGMIAVEAMATGTALAQIQNGEKIVGVNIDQPTGSLDIASAALIISLPDESQVRLSLDNISSLASLTINVFDLPRQATSLYTLLDRVGWQTYSAQLVTIAGRTALTLRTDVLPMDAVVYIDGNTINFASKDVPVENWPIDVKWIIIQ